jgi:uncharacterized protein YqiB (DUF1249 family)
MVFERRGTVSPCVCKTVCTITPSPSPKLSAKIYRDMPFPHTRNTKTFKRYKNELMIDQSLILFKEQDILI